ncbi:MAG: YbbR-like domain-containing protein [Anaerolineae bacterium]
MFQSHVDNLISLLLSFVLAIMVWMVAVNEGLGLPDTLSYPETGVVIETVNVPEGLVIFGDVNRRVTATVRAPRSNIDRLSSSDFRAYVDLSGLPPGLHEVPVHLQCPECDQKHVNLLGWEPDRLSIRLDEVAERSVLVDLNLQGGTAVGYQAEQPIADPKAVVVSGPRSLVEQVSSVRADIYLFNEDSTVQKEVSVVPIDDTGNLVLGADVEPRRVNVTVPIIPEGRRKEVAVAPVITGTVALGYYASSISVDPQTVVLTGTRSQVQEAPGFVETDPVSIAGAKDSVEVRVPIRIPEGLQLLDPTHQTVTVKVQVSPFTGGRTFEIEPLIQNLAHGLKADVSPPRIQVFLSGSLPDLEALQEDDVEVVLDLSERSVGRHRIRPTVLVSPESLEVRTLPELIDVTITMPATPTPKVTATPIPLR